MQPENTDYLFGLSDDDSAGVPNQGDAPEGAEPEPNQAPEAGYQPTHTGPDEGHPDTDAGDQPQGHPGQQKLWAGKYQSPEDLERSYQELEKKLGEQGNQLGTLQQQYQQLLTYLQQVQAMQPTSSPPQPASQGKLRAPEPDMDPDTFLQKLEAEGPKVVAEVAERVTRNVLEQEGQALGQGLSQFLSPMYQYYMQAQLRDTIKGQIKSLESKYQDFKDYKRDMYDVVNEQPALLFQQGGLELAYLAAKARKAQTTQQAVPQTAAMQQAMDSVKKAAQMPSSTAGNARKKQDQPSPEDAIKMAVFGDPGKPQGIFG